MQFLEENLATEDGLQLNVYRWIPEQAKAAVLISHGWSEHAARYAELAHWLAERGFEVHAYDHRGHGKSGGVRGHVRRWADYAHDLEQVRKTIDIKEQYLIGHSMGGLIAIQHMLLYPETFRAVALSGPATDVSYAVPKIKIWMSRALSQLWPTLTFSGEVNPEIVCGKGAVVEAYRNDPFNHGRVSARWFVEYLNAIDRVKQSAGNLTTPLAIWHGEKDALVEPWVSQQFFERLTGCEKQRHVVPDVLHEILYEENWPDLAGQMVDWFRRY